jgi:hypothetical protein
MKKLLIFSVIFVMAVLANPLPSQSATKVLVVPPSAMRPTTGGFTDLSWYAYQDGFYFSGYSYTATANAPIYLPVGATVKKLIVFYTDNGSDADEYIFVTLYRQNLATGISGQMVWMSSSGMISDPGRRTLKDNRIDYAVIDYHFSYTLTVSFILGHSSIRFHGAIIVYEE